MPRSTRRDLCFLALFLFLSTLLVAPASAAPVITGGPVNAASYTRDGLPNSGIAQGSMFILFGTGLGPANLIQANSFPLPTNLSGTSITIRVGGQTTAAIMIYTVFQQVAAILPSSVPVGNGSVTVTFNNQTSPSFGILVVASSFGIFARNQAGNGPAVVQNFNTSADQPVNSILTSAKPGQVETLWGTGLGAVTGNEAAGPLPGNLNLPVQVFVGGVSATVNYAGRSGCCAGVDQIVFVVPAGLSGCYHPVSVRVGGVMSNFTSMAIAAQGGPCSDPALLSAADVAKIQSSASVTVGAIPVYRLGINLSITGQGFLVGNYDSLNGAFSKYTAADLLASVGPLSREPSLGSCTVQQFMYTKFLSSILPEVNESVSHQPVHAGDKLTITGEAGIKSATEDIRNPGNYNGQVGGINPGSASLPDFLNPGTFTFDNGNGITPGVGAFSAMLTLPANIDWTNAVAPGTAIPRAQDLTVTWTSVDASTEYVLITGSSANTATFAGASFICTAPASAGTFTVPANILSALPVSGSATEGPVGFLAVGRTLLRQSAPFSAPGVDLGFLKYSLYQIRNVKFQ